MAYLVRMPEINLVEERESHYELKSHIYTRRTFEEPGLFPIYRVWWEYDFGTMSGWDGHYEYFPSKEAAEAGIAKVLNNEHTWMKYSPEWIEDES